MTSESFEILITDSPVLDYDKRKVLDHATVRFQRINEPVSFRLRGGRPEHQFLVTASHMGWFTEVELRLILHDQLARRLVLRNRSDLKVKRLWFSRGYYHGDSGRACFPVSAPRKHFDRPFTGELWFATLNPSAALRGARDRKALIAREIARTYRYGQTTSGQLRLALHDGFSYAMSWAAQSSEPRWDYRSTWFRGMERYAETTESAYLIKEAVRFGCHAVSASGYCDTDLI